MASGARFKTDLACEQCRRRKSKCDRVQPQCGSCARADTSCVFVDERPKRGPKKGELRALKDQVALLERQLAGQTGCVEFRPSTSTATSPQDEENVRLGMDQLEQNIHASINVAVGTVGWPDSELTVGWDDPLFDFPESHTSAASESSASMMAIDCVNLSDMVRADLDALYFERVHPFAPIIHKARYFSWADQESPSQVRTSLQLAMWTLAAAISTQFQSLSHALYAAARQALYRLSGDDHDLPWATGDIELEQIQALLLLAYYEFIRMERHHVLLTAARAFRLVQLTRLHAVDALAVPALKSSPEGLAGPQHEDDVHALDPELEEKRRTFWFAFCFDRLLNAHDSLSFTLQEEVICLQLPAPEDAFQSSRPCRTYLLAGALLETGHSTALNPFAETVVLAALYGRCLTHRRLAIATALNGKKVGTKDSSEFYRRHEWLASAVERRIVPLPEISLDPCDPMATFGHLLGRSAVIYLSDTAASWPWQTPEQQLIIANYEQRAYQAATDIVYLMCALPRLSYLIAHPFVPSTLAYTIAFLKRQVQMHMNQIWEDKKDCHAEKLLVCLRRFKDLYPSVKDPIEKLQADMKLC